MINSEKIFDFILYCITLILIIKNLRKNIYLSNENKMKVIHVLHNIFSIILFYEYLTYFNYVKVSINFIYPV